jgi:hypothetical protein
MPARYGVLLTTPKPSGLPQLPFYKQIAPLTPSESALARLRGTVHSRRLTERLNPLESALPKNRGRGVFGPDGAICPACAEPARASRRSRGERPQGSRRVSRSGIPTTFFPFIPFVFTFLRTLLRSQKTQLLSFQAIPNSFAKTPGGGIRIAFFYHWPHLSGPTHGSRKTDHQSRIEEPFRSRHSPLPPVQSLRFPQGDE